MDAYQKVGSGSENDPAMLASLGFALFDQGRFKEASEKFQQALSQGIMESAIPLYCAAAEFRQKKSYQFSLSESKEIIAKVDEALAMEPSAGYLYAKGLLIQALFEQKYLQYKQKSVDVLEKANTAGLSDEDRIEITQILGVDKR